MVNSSVQASLQHLEFFALLSCSLECALLSLWLETVGELCGLVWFCKPSPAKDKAQALILANLSGQKVSSLSKRTDHDLSNQMSLVTLLHRESGKSTGGLSLHPYLSRWLSWADAIAHDGPTTHCVVSQAHPCMSAELIFRSLIRYLHIIHSLKYQGDACPLSRADNLQ